ncbi:MAG: ComEC/Rec2 family competence protein [Gemmataceae bacterium]
MPTAPANLSIWYAPLVPMALAWSAGIVVDRLAPFAPLLAALVAFAALFAWMFRRQRDSLRALFPLWLAIAAVGALRHHVYLHAVPADDVRHRATAEGSIVHLRGTIEREPTTQRGKDDALRTFPAQDATRFVLRVTMIEAAGIEQQASGLVQVHVAARMEKVHVGDDVRLIGALKFPDGPSNPGGQDYAGYLRDQGISATLAVPPTPQAATLVRQGWPATFFGWLAVVRDWGATTLGSLLPPRQQALAQALLLGDGSAMTGDDWEKYLRTGVIHVLAISGQHLVVLAAFFGFVGRFMPIRRRTLATTIALALLAYSLLTGGRPPAMRAAWAVLLYSGGILLRRPVMPANVLAFAWLGVTILNPTDVFNTGCQLSFLAVAVLYWGTSWMHPTSEDPLDKLLDQSRSPLSRFALTAGRWIAMQYAMNALVWLAVAPLVAGRFHVLSPSALLLGPPIVWLSSLALLFGFGLLLFSPLGILAWPFAEFARLCLAGCESLVDLALRLPGSFQFVADIPSWWLAVFYIGLLAALVLPTLRERWRRMASAGAGWLFLGTLLTFGLLRPAELRIAFLDIGHGGCTVIETPDGKVRVYDAGSLAGPDITRRHIAPYLWHRGIRRIDELMLSHADLDHYNGAGSLAERFSIGAVVTTPTFRDRTTPGAQETIASLNARNIPFRIVKAGEEWDESGIAWQVLHPPAEGPAGPENVRSLTLRIKTPGLSLLITGDLEGDGMARVLMMPAEPVDVMQAPHHGSRLANVPALAAWATPKLVVVNQAMPKGKQVDPYAKYGGRMWSTWREGTVTIRRAGEKFEAMSFRTNQRMSW